jgi:hypothetical protein
MWWGNADMNGMFNPAALHALEASFDDPMDVIQADELELLRIGAEEVRTRCATFRLAETIVGVAMATRGLADDEAMLQVMKAVMSRVAQLRSTMLGTLGIDRSDAEFPAVFNAATKAAMTLVQAEWRWQKLVPERPMLLGMDAMAQVLDAVVKLYPERYALQPGGGLDLATVRRLMVYTCMPSLQGVVNWFDYFQPDRAGVVERLMHAVAEQAEQHILAQSAGVASAVGQRAIIERMYGASLHTMVETWKAQSQRDVQQLQELTALDRSVRMQLIEQNGGMAFEHVIEAHSQAMTRMGEMAELIAKAQGDS